jgi:hypothetical protein
MHPRRHIYAVALLVLSLALAATAEAAPVNELSLAAGVDSAYDSNVFNARGPDFVNRISPRGTYRLIDPRVKLDTAYELGYWTYAFGKAENSLNHRATVALEGTPTQRLTMRVADELSRAEDPGFLSRMGVVAPQIGIFDNVADALIGYALARRWYGSLGYTYHWARFDPYNAAQAAAYPALFDGSEHNAQAHVDFKATHIDDARMTGRVQMFTAGPQSVDANRWNLGITYSPTLGWNHHFLRELEASVDAGPLFYQALAESRFVPGAPSSGTTWRLAALVRWYTPTWHSSIAYTRDLVGATGAGSAIWADFVYAQAGYRLANRLDVHAGVGYFRNGRAVNQPLGYDGFNADAIIDWHAIANLHVGAYYTLRWQQIGPGAVPPGTPAAQFPDVTRNIVGVRLLAVVGADARPPRREVKE